MEVKQHLLQLLVGRLAAVETSGSENSRRLLHGRGKTIPGLEQINVDWFKPVLLVTLHASFPVSDWGQFLQPLTKHYQRLVTTVLIQFRYQNGSPTQVVYGQLPDNPVAIRGKQRFGLAFNRQQNIGYFLDMEPGRQWLERFAAGKRVLNLFAYTCAFSVVAISAGATSVVNVDMSSAALATGRRNHLLNGFTNAPVKYLKENILKSWSRIRRQGPFDIVIFDPPSFQKGSFIAQRDYAKLIRRIPELCANEAELLFCLNAPELTGNFIAQLINSELAHNISLTRLEPSDDFPDQNSERALKLFHGHYIGSDSELGSR